MKLNPSNTTHGHTLTDWSLLPIRKSKLWLAVPRSETDLRSDDETVAGVVIERHVRRHDVALRLQDDGDVAGNRKALQYGEPPAPVSAIGRDAAARVDCIVIGPAAAQRKRCLQRPPEKPARVLVADPVSSGTRVGLIGKEG